jgi:hypothetical protein
MEERGREVVQPLGGIAVLAVAQVALDDSAESGIPEEIAGQPVERGCIP